MISGVLCVLVGFDGPVGRDGRVGFSFAGLLGSVLLRCGTSAVIGLGFAHAWGDSDVPRPVSSFLLSPGFLLGPLRRSSVVCVV